MKTRKPNSKGFTLVELLVVIAIILILGAVVFGIGNRMIVKAKAATMAANMKQASTFFNAYASDNQQQLLPCRGDVILLDGSVDPDGLWHEIILSMIYEDVDPANFKDDEWLESSGTFLSNPLFKARDGWAALNPGYGYNLKIPENYDLAEGGNAADIELLKVPMAYLDEPTRIPILAPAINYYYRYDESEIGGFESRPLKTFLTDGNLPVLFLDGHIENVKPARYVSRRLHEMPLEPDP